MFYGIYFFSYFSAKIFEFSFNPWCKIGCLDAHALGQGVHKDIMKKKYLVEVLIFITEAYSEPYHTSKMDWTSKIVNGYGQLTIFARSFILEVWLVSEYAFVVQYWTIIASINYLIICFIVNYVVTHNPLIY